MVMSFRERSQQPELMDTEPVGFTEFHDCLLSLSTINRWTLAYRPTLAWFGTVTRNRRQGGVVQSRPISVFDIGSGGGDMLRSLKVWAQGRGLQVDLLGIDLNPWSKKSAELTAEPDASVRFETADCMAIDPDRRADFIISSLFTHHLSDQELVSFVQWMDRHATSGWFINDLHRHPVPYYFIKYAVRLLFSNRLIRHDAPLSVARAFTAAHWRDILSRAGVAPERAHIFWAFPFRYCVSCTRV
ncbi:MAG: methyltransferase domain-containing protein [Pseudomonadota bacterium]|nr:methyltransferase domain-containing protein [Pseudomonadota bacterium]